jgi:tetratricopeptide (TPR) repeat protein
VRAVCAPLILASALCAGPANADPTPPPTPTPASAAPEAAQTSAQREMELGVEAAKRGEHEAALAYYDKAAELVPEANLPHRYAAESLVALHRYEEAIERYETYLRIRPGVQDADAVREKIDELRARYLEGVVDVECTPEAAVVYVDDAPNAAGATPLRGLRLRAGQHRLTVRADGYRTGTFPAQVTAGTTRIVQCALDREAAHAVLRPLEPIPGPPSPEHKRSIFTTWWFWTGVGVVAAGAATVTVVALSSKSEAPHTDGGTLHFP